MTQELIYLPNRFTTYVLTEKTDLGLPAFGMMKRFPCRVLPFTLLFFGWLSILQGQANPVVPQQMLAPTWTRLRIGNVQPMGWLKVQMDEDLQGPIGKLDQLNPELYALPALFIQNKFSQRATPREAEIGLAQTIWWDGLIRHAILTRDKDLLAKADTCITFILSAQEEDGYLGMYSPETRYTPACLFGDIDYQANVLHSLLNWYAFTQDPDVLRAIERAVQQIYIHHPLRDQDDPDLNDSNAPSGTSGLALCDILFELYHLTGQQVNKDLLILMVRSVLSQKASSSNPTKDLSDSQYSAFQNATPRWLAAAWSLTLDPLLKDQLDEQLSSIKSRILPSGATSLETGLSTRSDYHLAALEELHSTYTFLLGLTSDPAFSESVEQLFMNAFSGMRLPEPSAITCLQMDENGIYPNGVDYFTSADSTGLACITAAGRVTPDYIQSLWYQDELGFVSPLFAPSEMNARYNGRQIRIQEITDFPGDHRIRYMVQTDSACTFRLKIRRPKWARAITINQPYTMAGDFLLIEKEWTGFDEVEIVFVPGISNNRTAQGARWYTFGPLVLVRPIPNVESGLPPGTGIVPGILHFKNNAPLTYSVVSTTKPTRTFAADPEDLRFSLKAQRSDTGIEETIRLVPMGSAVLRQTIFSEFKP